MENIIKGNKRKYDYKSIAVSSKNYEYLQNLGKTGMTFNEVLDNVLPLVKSAKINRETLRGIDYPKPETFDLIPITAKATNLNQLAKRSVKNE